jgi:hypothetical protein
MSDWILAAMSARRFRPISKWASAPIDAFQADRNAATELMMCKERPLSWAVG